jgi:uncharacterized protein YecA (UPF0149 family)
MVLTGEAEAAAKEHGEAWPEGKELEESNQHAQEDLAAGRFRNLSLLAGQARFRHMRRDGRKVGRNDPCPCGSGKKYKQCCGKAD